MRALPRTTAAVVLIVAGLAAGCSPTNEAPTDATTGASAPGLGRTLDETDQAALDDWLAGQAEVNGITDPPHVDMVRLVSAADFPSTQVTCLHDAGFPGVSLTGDGTTFGVELPSSDQAAVFNLAVYTCAAKYPRDPAQDRSRWTSEQKHTDYVYLTTTLVDCLTEQGFTITDIPSEETFLATWATNPWSPYAQVTAAGGGGEELSRTCPPDTPLELIWGD